ncbi:hypothetical protein WN943_008419 [Citrus x changshan-huyou]
MSITEYNGSALVAMVGKNCFAIASDRRLGVQLQTIATDFQRISKIHDRLFIGLSGLATDSQTLYQRLVFRHKLYQLREERDMKPETFASLVSALLYEKRFGPYFCQPVIAGLSDEDKPFICTMDSIGAKELAKDFVVAGTAGESLYGACEAMFKPDLEPDELFETVSQALLSSVDRDCLSGWGGHVYIVTVCVSTWDFICYIENFCVANLLKMAMVLGLSYIVLLFFYLLYKLGICWCIGHSLCKILWACLVSWFSIWEYCCTFFWVKLIKLKRRNQVHRRNIEHEFDTSEADAYYDYDVESYSFDDSPRNRSLSSRSREIDYRGTHLRKSLRPRSHNVRLGISRDSMHRHGHSHRRNTIKQHTHNGTIHGIKVAHSSKFVKKDRSNKRGAAYRSRRW